MNDLGAAARSVTYTIRHAIRDTSLDDDLARRHARGLVFEPLQGLSADEEYAGLVEALQSDARLSTWWGDPRYERDIPEAEFRAHLHRVVERMDAMRPWPTPLFRAADPDTWRAYADPRLIGVLRMRVPRLENRLHVHMTPITSRGVQHQIAVLILRSGNEIALVGHWWPEDRRAIAVLTRDPDVSAARVIAELTSGNHFETGEFDVVN